MKTGLITLLAQANAGKSSLVNHIVGQKLSIVTKKPQTTRKKIRGIYLDSERQVVFIDPPGIIKAHKGLNKFLQKQWISAVKECDGILALFNIDEKNIECIEELFQLAYKAKKPWAGVITKTDLSFSHRIEILKKKLQEESIPFCLSSIKKSEKITEDVLKLIDPWLKESDLLYHQDLYTTQTLREIFCEFTLESCFNCLHQEIPYQVAVKVQNFKESPQSLIAHINIIVHKTGHKAIVLGKGGSKIKEIREMTQKSLEKHLEKKVTLKFYITAKPHWFDHEKMIKELGYVTN